MRSSVSSLLRLDGLRANRVFESQDVDDTRERISRIMQPHRLLPSGTGRGHSYMDFVKLGGSGLGAIAFGEAMRVDVEALDNYYLLMFCTSGQAQVHSMGRSIDVDGANGVLCAPGQPFHAMLSPDCEQLLMRIDPGALAAELGKHPPSRPSRVQLNGPSLTNWLQQLQLIGGSRDMLDAAQAHPRLAGQLERLLIGLFALGHFTNDADAYGAARSSGASASPGFVKRADDFIRAHCRGPLTLQDITDAVDVPSRTLQQAFQQFKGAAPMQYLKQLRLELARQALLNGGTAVSVADIAMDCGFAHLGRFSLAYKALYGESPSETLRRRA